MIKKYLLRTRALMAAAILAFTTMACGVATADETAKSAVEEQLQEESDTLEETIDSSAYGASSASDKEETVYVMTDANGSANEVIVSEWLKNTKGTKELSDASNLSNIVNVKGSGTYTTNSDGTITWDAEGEDVYYQGTTNEELPVEVKVTYYLDGEEISPEDLAGKSGQVRIHFDYINNDVRTVSINGEDADIYAPYAFVSGAILDSEHFKNVEVTNGKVISQGNNYMVLGIALPGLRESLNISQESLDEYNEINEDIEIPESVDITADVTDFTLDMTMTYVSDNALSDLGFDDLTDSLDLDDIDDKVDELTEGVAALRDGGSELYDGTVELKDGAVTLYDGTSDLFDGTTALANGALDLKDGTASLAEGAAKLKSGTSSLKSGAATLKSGTSSLSSGVSTLKDGTSKLSSGAATLKSGSSSLSSGAATLRDGLNQLESATSSTDMSSALNSLTSGLGQLSQGATSLSDGADALVNGIDEKIVDILGKAGITVSTTDLSDNYISTITSTLTSKANECYAGAYKIALYEGKASVSTSTIKDNASDEDDKKTDEPTADTDETIAEDEEGATESAVDPTNDSTAENNTPSTDEAINENTGSENATETPSEQPNNAIVPESEETTQNEAETEETVVDDQARIDGDIILMDSEDPQTVDVTYDSLITTGRKLDKAVTSIETLWTIRANAVKLQSGAQDLEDGVNNMITALSSSDISSKLSQLTSAVSQLADGAESLASGASTLDSGVGSLQSGIDQVDSGTSTLLDGANSLDGGASTLLDGATTLDDGMQTLSDGATTLDDGAQTLIDGTDELNDGASKLKDGTSELKDGTVTLSDGAKELADGIIKLDDEGISKITELFDGDIEELKERLEAINDSVNTSTIGGAKDGCDTSVKYVIKTAGITTSNT